MAGYSLVIDISSDEENMRHSTPLKTVPLNMVGRLDLSDSSTEVYRGSDAELESSPESPAKETPTPRKKKRLTRVSFAYPKTSTLMTTMKNTRLLPSPLKVKKKKISPHWVMKGNEGLSWPREETDPPQTT